MAYLIFHKKLQIEIKLILRLEFWLLWFAGALTIGCMEEPMNILRMVTFLISVTHTKKKAMT